MFKVPKEVLHILTWDFWVGILIYFKQTNILRQILQRHGGRQWIEEVCLASECSKTLSEYDWINSFSSLCLQVYDGTAFLADHPGGAESILLASGMDSSEDFNAIHSAKAKKMLDDYYIGDLDDSAPSKHFTASKTHFSFILGAFH